MRRRCWSMAAMWGLGGCASSTPAGDAGPKPEVVTELVVDAPAGLAVAVDGEARGVTPFAPISLDPGSHQLAIESPCGDIATTVELASGETTRYSGIPSATLQIEGWDQKGRRLPVTVSLGVWTMPATSVTVPACSHRMRVRTPKLGAFMEDIVLAAGETLSRSVVLAPGPDMVRIAGGHYESGPVVEEREAWSEVGVPNYEWDVETFDMDRTEVTLGQFLRCYEEGDCRHDLVAMGEIDGPTRLDIPLCNMSLGVLAERWVPRPGRMDHPVNCLGLWAMEQYCGWVGKRLPTDIEWQFAAKSRKTAYTAPWGDRRTRDWPVHGLDQAFTVTAKAHTAAVCSYPEGNSEQGLCDMQGNVTELTYWPIPPKREAYARAGRFPMVERFYRSYGSDFRSNTPLWRDGASAARESEAHGGFRCARSVVATEVGR